MAISTWLSSPWPIPAMILGVLLVLGWWRSATRAGRASRARNRRARRGEEQAELLLARAGFEILDRQVERCWHIEVDGKPWQACVRADLLVRRRGLTYVAEVKTGSQAPDPLLPATRRQLLEYLLIFEPDGLLLVDVESGDLVEVAFPAV